MPILCKVERSEVRGRLRGLRITHPDMGLVMDYGSRTSEVEVRLVPQEQAFQMMADVERLKTLRMEREQAEAQAQPSRAPSHAKAQGILSRIGL